MESLSNIVRQQVSAAFADYAAMHYCHAAVLAARRRNEIYRGGLGATTSHASLSSPDLFVPGPKGRERIGQAIPK